MSSCTNGGSKGTIANGQFSGHGYTVKGHSQYGNTQDHRYKPTLNRENKQFSKSLSTITFNTAGTEMSSMLSKHDASETE